VSIFSKLTTFTVLCVSLLLNCGGGADIGNPGNIATFSISGCVKKPDDGRASNATVILGRSSDIPFIEKIKDTVIKNGIIIVYTRQYFDTVKCDTDGCFLFDNLSIGEYVIFAELQKKNGITKASTVNGDANVTVELKDPVNITINTYTTLDTTNPYFVGSRIAGTPLLAKADSAGVIRLNSVPSGVVDVVLYKSNNSWQTFTDLATSPVSGAVLMVDPKRSPAYWTVKTDERKSSDRPYVLRYGIWDASLPTEGTTEYDLYIQFSQPMEVLPTSNALHIVSSDSTIGIDEMSWEGPGLIYLRLCAKDSAGVCNRERLSNISSWTLSVDTSAASSFGYQMAWPEVFEVTR
jgi:hypothetical protein